MVQQSSNLNSPMGDRAFIIPAIDIMEGKCVRLSKGDYSQKVVYYEDPLEAAKLFNDKGFQRLHLVDLDGAKAGNIKNLKVLENISSNTGLKIDFGGGIKNINDVTSVFDAGASMIAVGSIAAKNPSLIEEWVMEFGADRILVGADVLNENIKISGWLEDAGVSVFDFIGKMIAAGVQNIFCTDISKDGMLQGASVELYKILFQQFSTLNLIASGGVSSINDIEELKNIGCKGVIIGKAFYEGRISLSQLSALNF
jgi:phosphoribosylformimino-5-aminoimidazole carboxamide ribotide isomerase